MTAIALPTAVVPPVATEPLLPDDERAVADPAGYFEVNGRNWDKVREQFKSKKISFESGNDDGKGRVVGMPPRGMNAMLAFRLRETLLKAADNSASTSPMESIQPAIRTAQSEQQARIKAKSGRAEAKAAVPLSWNYGAGSGTATSDIDSNLGGDATETAVVLFNAEFRKRWGVESGPAFDVNVYARDYLPAGMLGAANKGAIDRKENPGAISPDDNARWGTLNDKENKSAGVSFESSFKSGSEAKKRVVADQEAFSLLKMRKEMARFDWSRYRLEQLNMLSGAERVRKAEVFDSVEVLFEDREKAVQAKMTATDLAAQALKASPPSESAPAVKKPDAKAPKEGDPSYKSDGKRRHDRNHATPARVAAENRLYEAALQQVQAKREDLAAAREKLAATGVGLDLVEQLSEEVRGLLNRAAMYANEAYITNATVLHVVGNLQILGAKGDDATLSIKLSVDDYLASVNEQVAFIFDDVGREGDDTVKTLLKAGKYISRLGHAAGMVEAEIGSGIVPKKGRGDLLTGPTANEMNEFGDALMKLKDKPPEQRAGLAKQLQLGKIFPAALSITSFEQLILMFQSRTQALVSQSASASPAPGTDD